MKPEQLKVIAEGMGYYVNPSIEDGVTIDINGHWFDYKPDTTNNDQMVEIMEKLFEYKNLHVTGGDGIWVAQAKWKVQVHKDGFVSEGKTINEAVCNAAYEYFNV